MYVVVGFISIINEKELQHVNINVNGYRHVTSYDQVMVQPSKGVGV